MVGNVASNAGIMIVTPSTTLFSTSTSGGMAYGPKTPDGPQFVIDALYNTIVIKIQRVTYNM